MHKNYLAIDIGASSGRHIVGWMENGVLRTEEVYRFPNSVRRVDGHLEWDIDSLFVHVKQGIREVFAKYPEIESLSIDTWAVDYVLLKDGQSLSPVYAYRDKVNIALDHFDASINRISAWTVGFRNVEKALLSALCTPPCGTEGAAEHQPVYRADGTAGGAEDPALWGGLGRILPPERCAGRRCMV